MLLLALGAREFINGIVFLTIRVRLGVQSTCLRATYLAIGLGCLLGGPALCVLEAFTLKALYESNNYGMMLGLGIANSIFIVTFPITILMIIIAKIECQKK